MTRQGARVLAGLAVAFMACHPTSAEKTVVRRWLLCEECPSADLAAVVALGDNVTGMLGDALLKGPPASGREHIRRQAKEAYNRLPLPRPVSVDAFVGHYDSNYVASYQSHAAIALGQINTAQARALLRTAVQRDSAFRYDVVRSLAYAAPLALAPAAGDTQGAPPDSVVRINPTVQVRDSATKQALAGVRVVFTVDSGGGQVTDSVRRTGANGLASTQWTLGPASPGGGDSTNVLRATSLGQSITFRATAHGFTPRLAFVVQPSTVIQGDPIVPTVQVVALDAWDQRDSTLAGTAQANVIGFVYAVTQPMVAGQVAFPNLIPSFTGTGLRIRVKVTGATPVVSEPFDVTF